MNILVTGALGYIGSHLVQKLLGDSKNVVFAVFRNHLQESTFNLIPVIADLTDTNFTDSFPKNIDVIVHLAQSKGYRNFPDASDDIFSVNVRSTQLLLEWGRKNGIKKFIFASTGNVYKQQNKLLKETDICEPIGYYGASKYAAEQLIKPYNQFFQTNILRIFGVYGPTQKNMTIPNIINRIKNGQEITLAKNAGLYFTPLYIDDCVEMILCNIYKSMENSEIIYNLAGNEPVHLGKVLELVSGFINTITPIVRITDEEPMYLMGDDSLFSNDFSFTPSVKIEEGFKKMLSIIS